MNKQPVLGLLCASVLIMVHLTKVRARRVLRSHLVQLPVLQMKSRGASDWLEVTQPHKGSTGARVQPLPSRAHPETSYSVCCLKQEGHIGQERGELPLPVTLLLNLKQPAEGHAQGGFLNCGSSLNHEIDSPRDLVTFPPPVFTWRGERLHSGEDVQSVLWRWYRCCLLWGAEVGTKQNVGMQVCWMMRGPGRGCVSHGWHGRRAIWVGSQAWARGQHLVRGSSLGCAGGGSMGPCQKERPGERSALSFTPHCPSTFQPFPVTLWQLGVDRETNLGRSACPGGPGNLVLIPAFTATVCLGKVTLLLRVQFLHQQKWIN